MQIIFDAANSIRIVSHKENSSISPFMREKIPFKLSSSGSTTKKKNRQLPQKRGGI